MKLLFAKGGGKRVVAVVACLFGPARNNALLPGFYKAFIKIRGISIAEILVSSKGFLTSSTRSFQTRFFLHFRISFYFLPLFLKK